MIRQWNVVIPKKIRFYFQFFEMLHKDKEMAFQMRLWLTWKWERTSFCECLPNDMIHGTSYHCLCLYTWFSFHFMNDENDKLNNHYLDVFQFARKTSSTFIVCIISYKSTTWASEPMKWSVKSIKEASEKLSRFFSLLFKAKSSS